MSTETTPAFRTDLLNQWSDPVEFEVERERIVAYAEATNDDIAPARERRHRAAGVRGRARLRERWRRRGAEIIPPELILRIVHGEQDFRFHRPIEPGMTLVSKGAARRAPRNARRASRSSALRETRTTDGELVVEQYMTTFVRGAQRPESLGEGAPAPRVPTRPARARAARRGRRRPSTTTRPTATRDGIGRPDADPPRRQRRREQAGLPGIIIHGLCTMAFTSRAVIETVCPEDPARLQAARRALLASSRCPRRRSPLGSGTPGESGDRRAYAYETTSDSGAVVIKDGLAEIAR